MVVFLETLFFLGSGNEQGQLLQGLWAEAGA